MEKLTLPLQVRKNRFADLNASELVFADLADHISGKDFDAVQKLHGIVASVDRLDHKADLVLVKIAGIVIEIVADAHRYVLLANALCTLAVKLNGSSRVLLLRDVDAFQIDESLGCRAAGLCDALDGNFLDQPLVVRFHCVKAIDHIIDAVRLMSGGVAQRQQRREKFQIFLGGRSLDRLRLVNDQNRVCFGDDVDWAAGAEIIKLSEYNCCVFIRSFTAFQLFIRINRFVECLHIDNHNIYGAVRRKAVNFREVF